MVLRPTLYATIVSFLFRLDPFVVFLDEVHQPFHGFSLRPLNRSQKANDHGNQPQEKHGVGAA